MHETRQAFTCLNSSIPRTIWQQSLLGKPLNKILLIKPVAYVVDFLPPAPPVHHWSFLAAQTWRRFPSGLSLLSLNDWVLCRTHVKTHVALQHSACSSSLAYSLLFNDVITEQPKVQVCIYWIQCKKPHQFLSLRKSHWKRNEMTQWRIQEDPLGSNEPLRAFECAETHRLTDRIASNSQCTKHC